MSPLRGFCPNKKIGSYKIHAKKPLPTIQVDNGFIILTNLIIIIELVFFQFVFQVA